MLYKHAYENMLINAKENTIKINKYKQTIDDLQIKSNNSSGKKIKKTEKKNKYKNYKTEISSDDDTIKEESDEDNNVCYTTPNKPEPDTIVMTSQAKGGQNS